MIKILYRGFHIKKSGAITITLNGEKIKGEWAYGSLITQTRGRNSNELRGAWIVDYDTEFEVIPETIGQWVTTDKNGNDVFDGDIIKSKYNDGVYIVIYDEHDGRWRITNNCGGMIVPSHWALEHLGAEVIGNKWEVDE